MIIEIVEEGFQGQDKFGPMMCCAFIFGGTGGY